MTQLNMEKAKRIIGSLFWGVMIGGSLGIMESAICVGLWYTFGSPHFLIKPHIIGEAELVAMALVGGGIIVGLIFGVVVGVNALRRQVNVRFFPLYLSLLLLGVVIYTLLYALTLTFQVFPFAMACDLFLFFAGLRLARIFSLKNDPL